MWVNEYLKAKGYTRNDCRTPMRSTEVPKHLQDKYPTMEEYKQAIHEFLNEN